MKSVETFEFDPRKYYRLPWSLTDNGISWLEVTTHCNLACKGCYRDPAKEGHKTLEEIAADLAVFKKERKSDCMSIAGGDPLIHPKIVDIVRMIREGGWKPIVNTNGLALSKNLLHRLKEAGAFGFTFHVDTSQERKDSQVKTEREHNKLRQKFAEMLAEEGGLCCSFNQTVTSDTLNEIPDVVRWARQYPHIVNAVVFILFRGPQLFGQFDFYANGKKIDAGATYDHTEWAGKKVIKADDIVNTIRQVEPDFDPSGYLSGSIDPLSAKWLISVRLGSGDKTYGYVSPRFMELVQHGYHFLYDKWLSYSSPAFLKTGRVSAFVFSLLDRKMRTIAKNYMKHCLVKPSALFRKAHFQAFTIIQPIDLLQDGRANMCDGCPDMTVYQGKLHWSCRLEEIKNHGAFLTCVPKQPVRQHPISEGDQAEDVPAWVCKPGASDKPAHPSLPC